MSQENYYELLGIDENADASAIKKAYVKKIRLYPSETHPEEFQIIRKAYETLSNHQSRQQYDLLRQNNGKYGQDVEKALDLINKDEYGQALQIFQHLHNEVPEDSFVKFQLSFCHFRLGQYEQAKKLLNTLILDEPGNETFHFGIAKIYMEEKNFYKAIKHLERAIDLKPNDIVNYRELANCYFELDQLQRAFDILESTFNKIEVRDLISDFYVLYDMYCIAFIQQKDATSQVMLQRIEQLPTSSTEQERILYLQHPSWE
jgi:curved DNA-binding protein CbpA